MKKYNDCYVDTSSILHIVIEKLLDDFEFVDVTKEVLENVEHVEDEVGYKYFKLDDISAYLIEKYSVINKEKDKVYEPLIYVWSEQALSGIIYCYGNYRKKFWDKRGTLRGYA